MNYPMRADLVVGQKFPDYVQHLQPEFRVNYCKMITVSGKTYAR